MRLGAGAGLTFVGPKIGQQFVDTGGGVPPADPGAIAPTTLSAVSIQVDWVDNAIDEIGYKIERATDAGFTTNLTTVAITGAVPAVLATPQYIDTGLTPGTTYWYRITALGVSVDSNAITMDALGTTTSTGSVAFTSGFTIGFA